MFHGFRLSFCLVAGLLLGACQQLEAQVSVRDSAVSMTLITPSYALQLPGGDMAKRFGMNSSVGLAVTYKLKSNWFFDAEGAYIFGNRITEPGLFSQIATEQGFIIGSGGFYADAELGETGYYGTFSVGRLFPVLGPNPNSGFFVKAGLGFMQHKILIKDKKNNAPSIDGDYRKGYDRLTNGLCVREMAGYMYIGNNRLVNFYAGLELIQGFTEGRRSYNFNTMQSDAGKRLDLLFGARVGWIIPLYKEAPEKFYTY